MRAFLKSSSTTLVAVFLAAALSALALHLQSPAQAARLARTAQHATAQQLALTTQLAGTAYLDNNPTDGREGGFSDAILATVINALDPSAYNSVLSPLRGAFERVAVAMAVLLFFLSLIHAAATGDGGSGTLMAVFKKLAIVMLCLVLYRSWDWVLYRKIALPVAAQFNDPTLRNSMKNAYANSFAPGSPQQKYLKSPTGAAASKSTNDATAAIATDMVATCLAQLSQVSNDQFQTFPANPVSCRQLRNAVQTTNKVDRPAFLAMLDKNMALFPGEVNLRPEGQPALMYPKATLVRELFDTYILCGIDGEPTCTQKRADLQARPPYSDVAAPVDNCGLSPTCYLTKATEGFAESATDGLVNFITWLADILVQCVLFFMFMGNAVARAFSLLLGSIAIAWGMMPNKGNKHYDWFGDHAKLALAPIGLSLGALIFNVLISVLGAATYSENVFQNAGLKLAMMIGFVVLMVKGGAMTKLAAGDITSLAKDMGTAAVAAGTGLAAGAVTAGGLGALGVGKVAANKMGAATGLGSAFKRGVKDGVNNPNGTEESAASTAAQTGKAMGATDVGAADLTSAGAVKGLTGATAEKTGADKAAKASLGERMRAGLTPAAMVEGMGRSMGKIKHGKGVIGGTLKNAGRIGAGYSMGSRIGGELAQGNAGSAADLIKNAPKRVYDAAIASAQESMATDEKQAQKAEAALRQRREATRGARYLDPAVESGFTAANLKGSDERRSAVEAYLSSTPEGTVADLAGRPSEEAYTKFEQYMAPLENDHARTTLRAMANDPSLIANAGAYKISTRRNPQTGEAEIDMDPKLRRTLTTLINDNDTYRELFVAMGQTDGNVTLEGQSGAQKIQDFGQFATGNAAVQQFMAGLAELSADQRDRASAVTASIAALGTTSDAAALVRQHAVLVGKDSTLLMAPGEAAVAYANRVEGYELDVYAEQARAQLPQMGTSPAEALVRQADAQLSESIRLGDPGTIQAARHLLGLAMRERQADGVRVKRLKDMQAAKDDRLQQIGEWAVSGDFSEGIPPESRARVDEVLAFDSGQTLTGVTKTVADRDSLASTMAEALRQADVTLEASLKAHTANLGKLFDEAAFRASRGTIQRVRVDAGTKLEALLTARGARASDLGVIGEILNQRAAKIMAELQGGDAVAQATRKQQIKVARAARGGALTMEEATRLLALEELQDGQT